MYVHAMYVYASDNRYEKLMYFGCDILSPLPPPSRQVQYRHNSLVYIYEREENYGDFKGYFNIICIINDSFHQTKMMYPPLVPSLAEFMDLVYYHNERPIAI